MKYSSRKTIRFLVLSLIGIFLFFIPVWHGVIPVVALINQTRSLLGNAFPYISVISSFALLVELFLWKVCKNETMTRYFKGEKLRVIFWLLGIAIVILKVADAPLSFIQHEKIGGVILTLSSTVFLTIAIAGSLVIFIIKSGLVDFMAVLLEPVMRPIFKLPGEAAVNILSSFVSSASVGVYFTDQYYKTKRYTMRQACAVVSSFSVISVGYIGVIASLCGIEHRYGQLLILSFLLVLLMGALMVRIPPLSRIPNLHIDGSEEHQETEKLGFAGRFRKALAAGEAVAEECTPQAVLKNIVQSFQFAQKIVGVMIPTVTIVLTLVYQTKLFTYLGYPLIPYLKLCGVVDPEMVAPSVLIGIVEVSLPAIVISGTEAAEAARFFTALLSIVQIIFFSECGNAILASDIPLNIRKLLEIFLIRTAIAIPIVALITRWVVL